ncbi:MAG: hypothetical protein KAY37_05840 [Phycisphaerae bacterium]|nr:hypothetical protein [Phycisphaerae bacterium]
MSQKDYKKLSVEEVERVVADIPPEPRVEHIEQIEEWNEILLANVSEHTLHVLARGGDIVVFFDQEGDEIGWRDDGRRGAEQPKWIDRASFRTFVVRELELPPETRLGRLAPRELPPVGWTHQGVFLLPPGAAKYPLLRAWVDPEHNRVIQCMYGPLEESDEELDEGTSEEPRDD